MKVTVKINRAGLKAIRSNAQVALEQAAEATKTDIIKAQVIPFDDGHLQNDTYTDFKRITMGVARIVSPAVYARNLYYHPEWNFQTVNNPRAKGQWFEQWIDGDKKDFARKAYAIRLKALNEKGG